MTALRSIVITLFCLVAVSPQSEADTKTFQNSTGNCAINIANVSGNVQVQGSPCFDERVLTPLLEMINRQNREYREKEKEIESWIKRYLVLADRLGAPGAFADLRNEIMARFKANDLDGAGKLKEKLIEKQEPAIDQLAADLFDRAELFVLQLKPLDAQPFYARAFRYRPEVPRYAEAYARNLCDTNQPEKARAVYEHSIDELRGLAKDDFNRYAGSLSCTLVDLAGLYYDERSYHRARPIAEEALSIARNLSPADERQNLEHVADALTSLGVIEAKSGDRDSGKKKLLEANRIYNEINAKTSNRPVIFEVLAELAGYEDNRTEQEKNLLAALRFEKEFLTPSDLRRRGRFASLIDDIVQQYLSEGAVTKATNIYTELATFIDTLGQSDQTSVTFLLSVAANIKGKLLARGGDLEGAKRELIGSIQGYEKIRDALRIRESARYGNAHLSLGWVLMRQGEYDKALASFRTAVGVNRYSAGPQIRRSGEGERVAQFFVRDFPQAASELLSHSDTMSDFDKSYWDFLVRKHGDRTAKFDAWTSEQQSKVAQLLFQAASGRLPPSALKGAIDLAQTEKNPDDRCKMLFFVGETLLLLEEKTDGLLALGKCTADQEQLYPWIMKSRTMRWQATSR